MNKKTFCILPFVGMNVHLDGGLAPCCMWDHNNITHRFDNHLDWRGAGLEQVKKDLTSGVRNERCHRCWDQEDHGVVSYRQRWNDYYFGHTLFTDSWNGKELYELKFLHLDFDSFCNLKCIMCHPTVSSSLAAEYQSNRDSLTPFFGEINIDKSKWHESDLFPDFVEKIYGIETLILTGGEPLINPAVIKLLESLPLENINLVITTNATVLKPAVFDLLDRAKKTTVTVSLEGIGQHQEYLRYGCQWEDIDQNIKKLSTLKSNKIVPVVINHVLQHTSIYALPAVVDYALDHKLEININKLNFPPWLSIAGVPMETRLGVIDALKNRLPECQRARYPDSFLPWIKSAIIDLETTQYDPTLAKKFKEYTDSLDQIRGTDFQKTFLTLDE